MTDQKTPGYLASYEAFQSAIPDNGFPAEGMDPRAARNKIESYMWTDSNPMLNLSSFVTTFIEPDLREIMDKHAHVNYVDHDMYPKSYDLETAHGQDAPFAVQRAQGR